MFEHLREHTMSPDLDELTTDLGVSHAAHDRSNLRWIPIRSLGQSQRETILKHLMTLSAEDRQRRFGHVISDERLAAYTQSMDFERDALFGVYDRALRLAALVHLAFGALGALPEAMAEFGISVLPRMRGRGVGSLLFDHAATLARNRGVHTLMIHLARDNASMLNIVRKAGAGITFIGGDASASLSLPADTLGSQIQELLGHQAAELDFRLKRQGLRLPT